MAAAVGRNSVTHHFRSEDAAIKYIDRSFEIAGIYATFLRDKKSVTVTSKDGVSVELFIHIASLITPIRRASLRVQRAFIINAGLKSSF